MTKRELEQLFMNAAMSITGKRVIVTLQEPVIDGFDGEYYTVNGVPHIDISPRFDDATTLYIFAHEIGHAIEKHGEERSAGMAPRSQKLTPYGEMIRKAHPVTLEREKRADIHAKRILAYADVNFRSFGGFSELEKKLRCLAVWIPEEQQKRVLNVATAAALKVVDMHLWKQRQEKLYNKR